MSTGTVKPPRARRDPALAPRLGARPLRAGAGDPAPPPQHHCRRRSPPRFDWPRQWQRKARRQPLDACPNPTSARARFRARARADRQRSRARALREACGGLSRPLRNRRPAPRLRHPRWQPPADVLRLLAKYPQPHGPGCSRH
eukprot:scaffold16517_cov113-Isochrysis_galbana.AAC.2